VKKPWLCIASLSLMIASGWGLASGQTPNSSKNDTVVVKMDAALDAIVPADAKLEMLPAEGFEGGEGPVWVQEGKAGYLLFSDIPGNRIYKWTPDCFRYPCPVAGKLSVYLEHAGYQDASRSGAADPKGTRLNGTNGLTLDRQHRLLVDATGDRAIERIEKDGRHTILADRYEGKRLTCPNDIVVKSDGTIYFTDGAAGCLAGREDSPEKELPFHGVYLIKSGKLQLLDKDPEGIPPNGIALSPDEKTLYVTNGGPAPNQRKIFAYDIQSGGTVKNRRVSVDLTGEKGLGGPDGVKVDRQGNIYTAATGGLWIASPEGKRLGLIRAPEGLRFANLAFGDPDSKTLYLVTGKNLWRIRLNIPGVRP
jgi:gluconolactonase